MPDYLPTHRDPNLFTDDGLYHGPTKLPVVRRVIGCSECGREFNLADELDAKEWFYGHDCEAG